MTNCKCIGNDIETPEPLKCRCHDVALPDGRYEHATIVIEGGCITHVEGGEIPLYTPNVCCTGVGSGGSGVPGRPGDKGEPGENATITIGAVNTLAPGSQASVVNVGSATNAILEFSLPAGATGPSGANPNGITSEKGGFMVENGSVVGLPASWPPVLFIVASTNDTKIQLTASAPDANTGVVNLALDMSQYDSDLRDYVVGQINAAIEPLQNQVSSLNTALSALQAQVADLARRIP